MFKHILRILLIGLALSVPVQAAQTPSSYGPVGNQDTLWSIAAQLKPKGNVTVQQTMLAIYHKNPQAFSTNNINALMKGSRLRAPSYAEVRRYSRLGALQETRRQNRYWKRGVKLPKVAPPPIPNIKEPKPAKPASKPNAVAKAVPAPAKPASKPNAVAKTVSSPAKPAAKPTAKPAAEPAAASTAQTAAAVAAPAVAVATMTAQAQAQAPASPDPKLEAEIQTLRTQLQEKEAENLRLTNELQTLREKQAKSGTSPAIEQQVSKLKTQLDELKTVLDQKDNHIKTLQASLKSASEAIKSQHADNMRLADKLREVSPSSLPPQAGPVGKPELKLAATVENPPATTGPGATEAEANPSVEPSKTEAAPATADAAGQVWANGTATGEATNTAGAGKPAATNPTLSGLKPANDVAKTESIPLNQMLGFKNTQTNPSADGAEPTSRGISPLALAIAGISLFFILALAWRAYLQQRELRKIEAEEALIAEKMRKTLNDNMQNSGKKEASPVQPLSAPPAELHF